jgi:hypothetical protein
VLHKAVAIVVVAVTLVAAGCGDSGGSDTTESFVDDTFGEDPVAETTMDTTPPETSQATTPPETSQATTPPETSQATTPPETTTSSSPEGLGEEAAAAKADAIAEAASLLFPEDWIVEPVQSDGDAGPDTDDPFSLCATEVGAEFDVSTLDDLTLAIRSVTGNDPAGIPPSGQQATFEVRVFPAPEIAAAAWESFVAVLGTDEGRECYAGLLTEELVAEFPEGSEVTVTFDESVPAGADAGIEIALGFDVGGVSGFIVLDQFGSLCDDSTFVVSGVRSTEEAPEDDFVDDVFGLELICDS